jgi:hypothetical protein
MTCEHCGGLDHRPSVCPAWNGGVEVTDGGPAFPVLSEARVGDVSRSTSTPGMSLRDYFAGQALIAFCSCERFVVGMDIAAEKVSVGFKQAMAEHAYAMADAMLKERARHDG